MEAAIAAIISGFFALLVVFLKDHLDTRRERRRWVEDHPGQSVPPPRPPESDRKPARRDPANDKADDQASSSQEEDAPVAKARLRGLFVVLSWILALGAIGAVVLAWAEIETITFSLPALSIVGFLFAWVSRRNGTRLGVFVGLSPALVGLTCLGLISAADWGPRQADEPITMLLAACTVILVPLIVVSIRSSRIA